MKLHVKVLIVGGGVVGASIAYHLQKGGWDNIVLIDPKKSGKVTDIIFGVDADEKPVLKIIWKSLIF